MTIQEIGLDFHGHLFVRPMTDKAGEFAYIWRDASGIRWNAELRALIAAEPERWTVTDLYRQILTAVRSEYGIRLVISPATRWNRISSDIRASIKALQLDGS